MSKVVRLFVMLYVSTCKAQFKVSGVILSKNDNTPLPGVTIVEKETKNGTQTNFDGEFDLILSNKNAVLVISYLGFIHDLK